MPLPEPTPNQDHDQWMKACMSNDAMQEEFPDAKQRAAVCEQKWRDKDEAKAVTDGSVEDRERRCVRGIELRAESDGRAPMLIGYAAVFNKPSVDIGFIERIRPGAFAKVLKGKPDVRALVNHNPDLRLGRTIAKTLTLAEDKEGLRVEIIPPATQLGNDTVEDIRNGNLDGMSFSFYVGADEWHREDNVNIREIKEVSQLFDVGPVTFPAYPDTSIALRSLMHHAEKTGKTIGERIRRCLGAAQRLLRILRLRI